MRRISFDLQLRSRSRSCAPIRTLTSGASGLLVRLRGQNPLRLVSNSGFQVVLSSHELP
jgi:hypothetical protein